MIMELTMILASVALFIIAIVIGFVAGGVFFTVKQEYDEINKQIDRIRKEVAVLLDKENARLRAMSNRSVKTDDENKEDM